VRSISALQPKGGGATNSSIDWAAGNDRAEEFRQGPDQQHIDGGKHAMVVKFHL
jgi:hypothetical protein